MTFLPFLLSTPVTFTAPAMPLYRLMPELAKTAGEPWEVAKALRDEVVLVQVRNRDRGRLMEDLAAVTGGEWVTDKGRIRLERGAARVRQIQKAVLAERLALVRTALREMEEARRGKPAFDATAAKRLADAIEAFYRLPKPRDLNDGAAQDAWINGWLAINEGNAAETVTRDLAIEMDPLLYLPIEPGERAIFDRHPNRLQNPLGPLGDRAAAAFAQRHAFWQAEMKRRSRTALPNVIIGGDPRDGLDDVSASTMGVRLVVKGLETWDDAYNLRLFFRQPNGKMVQSGSEWVATRSEPKRRVPTWLTEPSKPFALEETESKVLEALFARSRGKTMEEAWRKRWLDPVANEPLAVLGGPIVGRAATLVDRDIVANLPDATAAAFTYFAYRREKPLNTFWLDLAQQMRIRIDEREGCLRMIPLDPVQNTADRAPREALKRFLSRSEELRRVEIDEAAQYVVTRPSLRSDSLGDLLLRALHPGSEQDDVDRPSLRLYGTLTAEQRRILAAGRLLPFPSLSLRQREIAQDIVFRRSPPAGTSSDFELAQNGEVGDLTDLFPNGLPAEGGLALSNQEEVALFLRTKHATGVSTASTPLRSMLDRAFTLNRASTDADAYFRSLGTLGLGSRQRVRLRLHLATDLTLTRELGEETTTPTYAAFDKLPAEQKEILRKAFADTRKRYSPTDRSSPPP